MKARKVEHKWLNNTAIQSNKACRRNSFNFVEGLSNLQMLYDSLTNYTLK